MFDELQRDDIGRPRAREFEQVVRRQYALIGHQRHGRASAQPCHSGKVPGGQRLFHQPHAELGQGRQTA